MTSRPLENEVGARRLSEDERAEGDFIASIGGSPGHRSIVLSNAGGWKFWAFCAPCGERSPRRAVKRWAQEDADRHNEENS